MALRAPEAGLLPDAFDIHGTSMSVTADNEGPARAIREFLGPFHRSALRRSPQVSFDVRTLLAQTAPSLDAEVMADHGALRMLRAGSRRIVEVRDLGWAEADMETAAGSISIAGWRESWSWSLTRLLFLPVWAQLLKRTGRYPLHAAGVARDDRALLFPASSCCGKTVLTLNLARAGYRLLGDDTQFIFHDDRGVAVGGFPESIALREGALPFFPDLTNRRITGGRILVDANELPTPPTNVARPGIIAFPRLTGTPDSNYRLMSRVEALRRLTTCTFYFTDGSTVAENMGAFSALVAESVCAELEVGTDAVRLVACVERLEEQA